MGAACFRLAISSPMYPEAALHLSAQWRCGPELGNALLKARADAEQRCDLGFTPLERAMRYGGNARMIQLLRDTEAVANSSMAAAGVPPTK